LTVENIYRGKEKDKFREIDEMNHNVKSKEEFCMKRLIGLIMLVVTFGAVNAQTTVRGEDAAVWATKQLLTKMKIEKRLSEVKDLDVINQATDLTTGVDSEILGKIEKGAPVIIMEKYDTGWGPDHQGFALVTIIGVVPLESISSNRSLCKFKITSGSQSSGNTTKNSASKKPDGIDAGSGFYFKNVSIKSPEYGFRTVIGEVVNRSSKSWNMVTFVLSVYDGSERLLATTNIIVSNIGAGDTKSWDAMLEDVSGISKYKVQFEAGF
jgi:hypothetical protein